MALTLSPQRLLAAATTLAVMVTLGGCQDWVRDAKNIGDYLNLRNSLLDPSQVGRFDKANPWGTSKPVVWPILEQLDAIDDPNQHWVNATDPLPSDLVAEQKEYVVGEGDKLGVQVYELVVPGVMYEKQADVNELGNITLTNLGAVHVAGLTPTQVEEKVGQIAVEKGLLLPKSNTSPGPQVSVQVLLSQAKVFHTLGMVGGPGTYYIQGTDFRLLNALAMTHDIAGGTQPGMDYLYIIRPQKGAGVVSAENTTQPSTGTTGGNPLESLDKIGGGMGPAVAPGTPPTTTPETVPTTPTGPGTGPGSPQPTSKAPVGAPADGTKIASDKPVFVRELPRSILMLSQNPSLQGDLDAAIRGGPATAPGASQTAGAATEPAGTAMPGSSTPGTGAATATGAPAQGDLMSQAGAGSKPGMIYVDGKWVEVSPSTAMQNMSQNEAIAAATGMTGTRVIRIPITHLLEGDPRYNVVIRPGDIIRVPNIEPGEFYLMGHVGRPGVYSLTGRKVTLKMAIAASGGLDAVAIPRRCDLIRRVGNTEVTIQVDLQRIFDAEQPDIFLKPYDLVNVGTDMIAPFLAVTRNAYRASYGWAFTYDRNFYNQPVINQVQR